MFLDENYLLENEPAKKLYTQIARLPILDPHNHVDVRAIAGDRPFADLWELLGATDHYVWEVMRKRGIPEELITGKAAPADKFSALARIFPELAGNPVYEWIHLDLRFLGISDLLNADNAARIWRDGSRLLQQKTPLELLRASNVEVMCSTDDPADTLEFHEAVNHRAGWTLVRPTWRPDKAMKLHSPGWRAYLEQLAARFGRPIGSLRQLLDALKLSHDYFAARGCRASDHGLEVMAGAQCDWRIAERAFAKAETATPEEAAHFAGVLLMAFGEWNVAADWVTQLHLGPVRDVRAGLFERLGPDAGGDISSLHQDQLPGLLAFLNRYDDRLKVVLYCLDPMQQPTLAAVSRAFGGKVRLGAAWWLNDTPIGMKRQLEYIGSVDLLMNFGGMVSDSRKISSYQSRFEMFRRVLSSQIGALIQHGQIPEKVGSALAGKMAYEEVKVFWKLG
ncbi:glucuronate isomerase [Victivallis sp. Marseille-Q1083]|uniref:glucuronate isomerase n=1 Tax=Victivallis sp. Marseille-Q1083 TaxID=2717288 RepID=UPI00158C0257|nr:glucuronate isomerase [Victivallis sp. Marseille-Q1083]